MAFIFISDLWNAWNIRGVVLLSLLLQVLLILFAPLRRKIANYLITFLLWLAYLMADSVVVYGVGLISHKLGNPSTHGGEVNGAVQALWASFLLLHLGGPDTITAFSREDNSLWQRHLLNLVFQVGAAIYVFVQIFPMDKSLVIPTMLVFSLGVVKNAERILALQLSSLPILWDSMSPYYAYKELNSCHKALDVYGYSSEEAKLAESIVVEHAYRFFDSFKVFLVDLIFTNYQRNASLEYFHKVSPLDALRVISIELQFMYERLHTKALVIRSKCSYIFRFIALNVLVVAFILFHRSKKHWLSDVDIEITYSLLCGGIALDVMALFILVFSDWTVGVIKCRNTTSSRLNSFLDKLVSTTDYLRKVQFVAFEVEPSAGHTYEALDTPLIFRRWSESISACNLLSEGWKESPRKMKKCNRGWIVIAFSKICSFPFHMAENIISCFRRVYDIVGECYCLREPFTILRPKYGYKNPFLKKLWIFIFEEVKRKSGEGKSEEGDKSEMFRQIFEARGDRWLLNCKLEENSEVKDKLLCFITDFNYSTSILCWHIATGLWYEKEKSTGENEEREFSKILSDYMVYLLISQPNVMSAVAGDAQFVLRGTSKTLRTFSGPIADIKEKYMRCLEDPSKLRGYVDPSPGTEGFLVAQEIGKLGDKKWEVMSGVWVEMLSYAAGHIKGETHAQVLSKGGELLAFIWLLMAHFGCLYKHPWGFSE